MKRTAALLIPLATAVALAPAAVAAEWTLDPGESRIAFAGEQKGGVRFEGTFGEFTAAVSFDRENLSDAHVRLTIDMRSAATDSNQRDEILHQAAWLDSAEFPEASFELTGLEQAGADAFIAHGTLTVRGNAQPIDVPVTVEISDEEARASGSLTVDRRDYGVGQGAWGETDEWVAYPIEVTFELVARQLG